MNTPAILHIPHAATKIPEQLRGGYCCDLERELLHMTDWYTDDLFDLPADKLVAPVSRLVCDVERFRNDTDEEMAQIGMGAIYTHGYRQTLLRTVTQEGKEQLLQTWYDPHHAALTELVREKLTAFRRCLIVDCHSFSPRPLPYERDQNDGRPDICIGTDSFHTPEELALEMESRFRKEGYSVARNRPYAGALVPSEFYQKDLRVRAVMIEVNRGLYMDRQGKKGAGYSRTKEKIRRVLMPLLEK